MTEEDITDKELEELFKAYFEELETAFQQRKGIKGLLIICENSEELSILEHYLKCDDVMGEVIKTESGDQVLKLKIAHIRPLKRLLP